MKVKMIAGLAMLATFVACKTPYKATDNPAPTSDSTASSMDSTQMRSTTDSSSTMSSMDTKTSSTDTATSTMPTDSSRTNPVSDSTKMPSAMDTAMKSATDSSRSPLQADTTGSGVNSAMNNADPKTDSTTDTATGTGSKTLTVPENIQSAFTKQYPNASKAQWSNYDSLAAVPIDLRMAGWKKMKSEDYLVKFAMDEDDYYAWYDSEGQWVGSAYNMKDPTKLPAAVNTAVKNAIKTRYAGYTITNVNREFQKEKKAYEVELMKDDSKVKMLVNEDGKITQVFKYVQDKK